MSTETDERFRAAVNIIKNLPKDGPFQPSNSLMLKFYAYYKQATEGPNTSTKPPFWDVVKKVKWEAWKKLGNMSRESAMNNYVEEFKKVIIVEKLSYSADMMNMTSDELNAFYENLPSKDLDLLIGPVIERVRSQPGSPLCTSPITSREASPDRNQSNHIGVNKDGLNGVEDMKCKQPEMNRNSSVISSGVSSDEENFPADKLKNEQENTGKNIENMELNKNDRKTIAGCNSNFVASDANDVNVQVLPSNGPFITAADNLLFCNDQQVIKNAIVKLQRDVQDVFRKLHFLETHLKETKQAKAMRKQKSDKFQIQSVISRYPSAILFFIIIWPFIIQFTWRWLRTKTIKK